MSRRSECRHSSVTWLSLHVEYCVPCSGWRCTVLRRGAGGPSGTRSLYSVEDAEVLWLDHESGPEELVALVNRMARITWEDEMDARGV